MAVISGSNSSGAWINFNGTGTIATRDSYNISSISDEGSGKYQINFDSSMSNNDYAVAANASHTDEDNSNPCFAEIYNADTTQETGRIRVKVGFGIHAHTNNFGFGDRSHVWVIIMGDR
tara:strand:+ start:51 stop:407 length:357 start_codon:yes stop_codon:yes gene_type:complete